MRGRAAITAFVAAAILAPAGVAGATPTTVYSNIPSALPGDLPSWSFEEEGTQELGGQVALAPGARTNPVVTVTLSSWECQFSGAYLNGGWQAPCISNPGATFEQVITLRLYEVGPNNSVGRLLVNDSELFHMPYRPSSSPLCVNADYGKWFDAAEGRCFNGLATNVSFNLGGHGVTLPDSVIVSVAYQPNNSFNPLNVALIQGPPTVGSDPLPEAAYLDAPNVTTCGKKFTLFGTDGRFELVPKGWASCQPAIRIDTWEPPAAPGGAQGGAGAPTGTSSGASGPAGTTGGGANGGVLGSSVKSGSGIARLARRGLRLHIWRGGVAIPIRCDGKAGLLCRSRLQVVAGKWSAKRAFRLRTVTGIRWVRIRLPGGLVRAAHRTRHGLRAYVEVTSGLIARAAAVNRGTERLIA